MSNIMMTCNRCGRPRRVPHRFEKAGVCPCGGQLVAIKKEQSGRRPATKVRSKDQERRASQRYGGRVQPASGALDHVKGDVRDKGQSRGECKFTLAKSYTLRLDDLLKIMQEANVDEVPFLEIEFQGVHPYRRFAVVPDWVLQRILEHGG